MGGPHTPLTSVQPAPVEGAGCPRMFLQAAISQERSGSLDEALRGYEAVADQAERESDRATYSEALRRMAVVHQRRGDAGAARELCERSLGVAAEIGDDLLGAESLNTLASFDFEMGNMDLARQRYQRALRLGGDHAPLRGRVEQNLGILCNIQGDHEGAVAHYARSLEAFEWVGDDRGRAIAYHNLGMVHADRSQWEEANRYFRESHALATETGDVHLQGLCSLNHAEVFLAQQQYDRARAGAESALAIFDRLDSRIDKADAYKVIGRVFRETGRLALAESRLKAAIEIAVSSASVLSVAEASRELALLYQA
ncbi:MAG TPA: tetratricopeptide repeat protein, partial [Gemmatimonadales bacterium]|nr:tetratricopeptide repeat protein [Gemmatimonadales bacterium]